MTANPFDKIGTARVARKSRKELIDEGNARLATNGRHGLHWYVYNDEITLGYRPLAPVLWIVG